MTERNNGHDENDTYIEKIMESVEDYEEAKDERHEQREKHEIDNGHENAPDEGSEDVPTKDKVIRDPETGEETFIKNDNKEWERK